MDDEVGFFRVAGVSFYQDELSRCVAGQPVRFVHEPDNPHDEMALRVVSMTGETIGYVPRASWARYAVHQLGRGLSGVISSLGYSRSCQLGALISVAVCDDAPMVSSYYQDRPAPPEPTGGFRYWVRTPTGVGPRAAEQR